MVRVRIAGAPMPLTCAHARAVCSLKRAWCSAMAWVADPPPPPVAYAVRARFAAGVLPPFELRITSIIRHGRSTAGGAAPELRAGSPLRAVNATVRLRVSDALQPAGAPADLELVFGDVGELTEAVRASAALRST